MNNLRPILTPDEETNTNSFSRRLYKRLEEALQDGTQVTLRLSWGSLSGIPIYLDATCVEIVYVYVDTDEFDEPTDEISWRTVWLVRLEEVIAVSYVSESWSKERFEQLFDQTDPGTETE